MTTEIAEKGTSYSQCASMISRPLLAMVAESIVIFAPIRHVGWRSACSGVAVARSATLACRKGPPEAVSSKRATLAWRSPTRHCQIAECSESMGRSQPSGLASGWFGSPVAVAVPAARPRTSGITRWPPATSVSLLAVATTFPALSAASTDRRATNPPVATRTRSTSERVTKDSRASAPVAISVPGGRSRRPAARSSASETTAGRSKRACSSSSCACEPVASATTRNASGLRAMTSTAWRPTDPPEPRSATRRGPLPAERPPSADKSCDIRRHHWGRKDECVRPIENAAVARDQVPRVLGAPCPLEHRCRQAPRLRRDADNRAEQQAKYRRLAEGPQANERDDGRSGDASEDAPVALGRRNVAQELALAHGSPQEVSTRVEGPDQQDHQQDPASRGAQLKRRRSAGERRGDLPDSYEGT